MLVEVPVPDMPAGTSICLPTREVTCQQTATVLSLPPHPPACRATEAARRRLYSIVGTLWPKAAGPAPTYEELMAPLNITSLTDNITACYDNQANPDSPQAATLAALGFKATQPNKIWSLVHFVMHNQPDPMSSAKVAASRALANYLLDNFW